MRVKEVLEMQPFLKDFSFVVGRSDRIFLHNNGNIDMNKTVPVASSSKLVSNSLVLKYIESGKIHLDD